MVKDSEAHREPRNGKGKRPDEQKQKKGRSTARRSKN